MFRFIRILTVSLGAITSVATLSHAQTIIPAADGTATVVMPNGNTFNITGGSLSGDGKNLFHSFQEFGLSTQQIANFIANPTIQNILGRVVGGNPSLINGLIQVSGGQANLFLMNPSGMVFGPNAALNVPASFAATTATGIGFSNGQFNAYGANDYQSLLGNPQTFVFQGIQPGAIINAGDLAVTAGEGISLVGGTVINTGTIAAPGGDITLAAVPGSSLVRISQAGQVISLEVPLPIDAEGNPLPFNATDLPALLTNSALDTGLTVTPQGIVQMNASGAQIPTTPGTNIVASQLSTATDSAAGLGGTIQITGTQVGLVGANLDASGTDGGGKILVGGEYKGQGDLPTAQNTYVSGNSVLKANAINQGDGGEVIVWADGNTAFAGNIEAKGGIAAGDGGFVEVSGKGNLAFNGQVNLQAPQGEAGTLLLDPKNITIVPGSGAKDDPQVDDGQILLDDGPGQDYTISEFALEALSGDTNVLLEAADNITVAPGTTLNFSAGTGTITFTADANNDNIGAFSMDLTDTIFTSGRSIAIEGAVVTASLFTGGGNVNISGGSVNGLDVDTGGGDFLATVDTSFNSDSQIQSTSGGAFSVNSGRDITVGGIQTGTSSEVPGGDISLQAVQTVTINGNGGFITEGGNVFVQGFSNITIGQNINTSNPFDPINPGGNLDIVANGTITQSPTSFITVGGDASFTTGGDIFYIGGVTVSGITTLNAGSNNISLHSAGNDLGRVNATGQDIVLQDINGIDLGTVIATTLRVTAGGDITDSGDVTVSSTTTLDAGSNNITLDSTNDLGTINATGQDIVLQDINEIGLGTVNATTLGVTTGGDITDSGDVTVSGTTTLDAGSNNITLDSAGNDLGTINATGQDIVLLQDINGNGIDLGTVNATTLEVTTGGDITDSGDVTVSGTTTLDADAGSNNISLDSAGNDLGTINATGQDIVLQDINGIDLGTVNATTLGVTAGGDITDSGDVTVSGTTTLDAGNNNITLDSTNDLGTVNATGQDIVLQDINGIDLGTVNATTLGVTAGGDITDSGDVTVSGTTTLDAGSNNIILDSTNDLGTVNATGQDIVLQDINGIDLGTVNATTLEVTTGGDIIDSGDVTVSGTTTLDAEDAGSNNITLDSAGNDFNTVNIFGNNVTLTDANSIDLGSFIDTLGDLTVNAGGAITQGTESSLFVSGNASFTTTGDLGDVTIYIVLDGLPLVLDQVLIGGNFNLETNGNNVSQTPSGQVQVAGQTNISAFTTDLNNANNIINGSGSNSTPSVNIDELGNVAITQAGIVDISSVLNANEVGTNISGDLTVISQDIVEGTSFNGTAITGQAISLNGLNNFNGTISIRTAAPEIVSINTPITPGISQTDAISVGGTTQLDATSAGDVTLNSTGNDFNTVSVTAANNVSLIDANNLDLGASNITGNLDINTEGGDITDSGDVIVGGATTLDAGINAIYDIILDSSGNDFNAVNVIGSNVTLTDANSIDLGRIFVDGEGGSSLTINAGGAITQNDESSITVYGNASFTTTGSLGDVTLNMFTDGGPLVLDQVLIGGNFNLAARSSNVSQTPSGQVQVAGRTTISAFTTDLNNANNITNDSGSNLTPSVEVDPLGNVTITQAGIVDISSALIADGQVLDISGNLTVISQDTAEGIGFNGETITGQAITLGGNNFIQGTISIQTAAPEIVSTNTPVTPGISQTEAISVGGTTQLDATTAGDVTLNSTGNDFNTVNVTAANNVSLNDSNNIDLGSLNSQGNLDIVAGGAITQNSQSSLVGSNINLQATQSVDISGDLTTGGGSVEISGERIAFSGFINTDTISSGLGGNINLQAAQSVEISGLMQTGGGSVEVNSESIVVSGFIRTFDISGTTPGGNVDITATTLFQSAGLIDTSSSIGGGTVTVESGGDVVTGGITTGAGDLTIIAGGNITNGGDVTVGGTTTLDAGSNNITLDSTGNDFGTVNTTGQDIVLRDINGIDLGTVNATTLGVTAGGDITDSGDVTVSGTTTLDAGSNNITLDSTGNDFGTVNATGQDIVLRDINGIDLGTVNATTLGVTAGGDITDSGDVTVSSTTTLDAGSNNITLDSTGNDFGTVNATGQDIVLQDINGIDLGTVNATTLGVTTGGDITDSGDVIVGGATTLNAGSNNITLDSTGNDFGTVNATGQDIVLRDINGIDLGTVNATTLGVTAGGDITDSGDVTVSSTTTLDAGSNNITLDSTGNDFGTVNTTGQDIVLQDINGIDLGTVNATTLGVTAGGDITDSGDVTVSSTTTLDAGSNNITLDSAGNDFNTVNISGNNVTLTDANSIDLGSFIDTLGDLTVNAGGAITQGVESSLFVSGNASFTTTGDLGDVALNTTENTVLDQVLIGGNFNLIADTSVSQTPEGQVQVAGTTNISEPNNLNNANNIINGSGSNLTPTVDVDPLLGNVTITQAGIVDISDALIANGQGLGISGNLTVISRDTAEGIAFNGEPIIGQAITLDGFNVILGTISIQTAAPEIVSTNTPVTPGISQTEAISVGGTTQLDATSAGDVTLNSTGNDFNTVNVTAANNVSLNDSNNIDLGSLNTQGNLDIVAGGAITQNGESSISAGGNASFTTTGNLGDVTLNLSNDVVDPIVLDQVLIGGNFNLSAGASVSQTVVGQVQVAGATNIPEPNNLNNANNIINGSGSNLTPTVDVDPLLGDVTITQAGIVDISDALSINGLGFDISGNLTVISQDTAEGIAFNGEPIIGQAITLDGFNVILGTISIQTAAPEIVSTNTPVTPGISQTDAIGVGGITQLDATSAGNVTLTQPNNNFNTVNITAANNVTLTDANNLDLGPSNITGNLEINTAGSEGITPGGNITDSGNVTVGGETILNAGSNNITLDSTGNDFGTVNTTGQDIVLQDINGIDLETINATTLGVTAGGNITDSGNVTVSGTTTLDAGTNNITLDSTGNDFGTVNATGQDIVLQDINGIDLGTVNATTLGVTTGGDITDSGDVTVGGTTTLDADAGSNNISLDSAGNDLGTINATGQDIVLQDINEIDLGTVNATTLGVTAGGDITDSGDVTVSDTTTLDAGTNNITLDSTNDLGTVNATGQDIVLQDINGIDLGTVNATTLGITAGGDITDSGDVTVSDTTTLDASSNNITLDSTGNDFNTVNATGQDIILQDVNEIDLGTVNATTLGVTAGGDITNSGDVTVSGTTTLDASNNNITLDSMGNDFNQVTIRAQNASLVDANGIEFIEESVIANNLSVNANGNITEQSSILVNGLTTLNAGENNNIILDSLDNDFGTVAVIGNANNVTIADANNLTLTSLDDQGFVTDLVISGDLDLNAQESVTIGTNLNAGSVNINPLATTFLKGNIITSTYQNYGDLVIQVDDGNQLLTSSGSILTGDIQSNGENINISADSVQTANITTDGGNITLQANKNVKTGDLLTISNGGGAQGGDITINAGENITLGNLNTSGVNGGNIFLSASGDVTAVTINTQGNNQGQGGNVEIRAGGDIRITESFIDQDGVIASISTTGDGGGGGVTIQSGNTPFIVGDASVNGTAGDINTGNSLISNEAFDFTTERGDIGLILQDEPTIDCGADCQTVLQTPIEAEKEQEEEKFESSVVAVSSSQGTQIKGIQQAVNVLDTIEAQTGKQPALIYVNFTLPDIDSSTYDDKQFNQLESSLISEYQTLITPKLANALPTLAIPSQADYQLELIVITQGQEPYRIAVPQATRKKVLIASSRLLNLISKQQDGYLPFASELYQWLIEPLEITIEKQGIESTLFFMPDGLRTLPIAALYDESKQEYVVEKNFSVGTAPSLNLVDYSYRDLSQVPVLAFGATEFPEQNQTPLPGVGVELPLITSIKGGEYFLNEQFNLANLETQRQNTPHPIVHLATHADFLEAAPRKSYVQLYNQKLELPQWDQLDLNLPATDLLVVSACNTAVGNPAVELGFGGLAVQAGVKTALASLWPVGDIGTVGLMDGFYRNLKTVPIKSEALQFAQRALLSGEYRWENNQLVTPHGVIEFSDLDPEKLKNLKNLDLSHPYFWSAFMMIGSPW